MLARLCKSQIIESTNFINILNHSSAHTINMFQGLLSLIGLPIYHFIIYPPLYNYIPDILKRIGLGMVLLLLALLSSSVVEVTQANHTCVMLSGSIPEPVTSYWQTIPNILFSFSVVIFAYTLCEFVMCQSPCQMKGITMTVATAFWGLFTVLGYFLNVIIWTYVIPQVSWCAFYDYILHCILIVIVLIVYVIAAKWYKFRKRNDIVPFHMFAEEEFESNYRQEKNYRKSFDY